VQGMPEINNIPSVQGAPSSLGGLSSAAPSVPSQTPHGSAPSVPSHLTHPLPKENPSGHYPPHQHSHPHTEPYQHPHNEHHPHPHTEHHTDTQPLSKSQSNSNSLKSAVSQQALSTGVSVAGHISRRAFLIAIGGAAAVTVGVGTVVYVKNAISTPEKTISNFLEAVKRRDGQTAYEQLSSRLQSQINEQQYISNINLVGGFIGSYNISNVQESDSNATASVSFTALIVTANYTVELVKENGVWKIDGGTLINYY
jgi:hypothetical protein